MAKNNAKSDADPAAEAEAVTDAPAAEAAEATEAAETPEAEAPAAEAAPETPAAEAEADAPAAEVESDAPAAEGDEAAPAPEGDAAVAEATEGEPEVDEAAIRAKVLKPAKDARYGATGKRKTSVARVIVTPGDGTFWINGRTLEDYFPRHGARVAVMEPLVLLGAVGAYSVRARIHGGGPQSQAGALRHGISRALAEIDPIVRTQLKGKGFLKLDARQVERKKAGLKKARKRPQFSKR